MTIRQYRFFFQQKRTQTMLDWVSTNVFFYVLGYRCYMCNIIITIRRRRCILDDVFNCRRSFTWSILFRIIIWCTSWYTNISSFNRRIFTQYSRIIQSTWYWFNLNIFSMVFNSLFQCFSCQIYISFMGLFFFFMVLWYYFKSV